MSAQQLISNYFATRTARQNAIIAALQTSGAQAVRAAAGQS